MLFYNLILAFYLTKNIFVKFITRNFKILYTDHLKHVLPSNSWPLFTDAKLYWPVLKGAYFFNNPIQTPEPDWFHQFGPISWTIPSMLNLLKWSKNRITSCQKQIEYTPKRLQKIHIPMIWIWTFNGFEIWN